MKKILVILALLWILAFTGKAEADPWTWTDVYNPQPDIYFASGIRDSYSFTQDIRDNGFNVGADIVYNYSLSISLYDDNDRAAERALINLPGVISDGFYNFSFSSNTFGMSLTGWAKLNSSGLLDVSIERISGDFYFGDSTLTATGWEANPVAAAEPTTLLLLGSGLVGLGLLGRRKFKAKR